MPLAPLAVALKLTDDVPRSCTVLSQLNVPWVGLVCCQPAGVAPAPCSKPGLDTVRVTGVKVTSSNHAVPVLLPDLRKIWT